MVIKLKMILYAFHVRAQTIGALGIQAYNRIFQSQSQQQIQDQRTATPPAPRIINGELVGKPLDPGKGKVIVPPDQCSHPEDRIKRGANDNRRSGGGIKWWKCWDCQSRWERSPMDAIRPVWERVPRDDDVLTQGRYMGTNYSEVLNRDPMYCNWVVTTSQQEMSMEWVNHFALYIMNRQSQMMEEAQYPTDWEDIEDKNAEEL